MKLPVRHEAFVELDEAITFYEEQRPGLGLELLDAVAATVSFAAAFPEAGESRGGSLERFETRRYLVKRFPYLVYVATVHGRREVIAIAHASRRPGYWRDRLG